MKPHLPLQGFITALLVFTAAGKGCDGPSPSAPECFRRDNLQTMYVCEWSSPYKAWNHTVYMNCSRKSVNNFKATRPEFIEIREEKLYQACLADIWVEAHNEMSRCTSQKTSATLRDKIKYKNPQNVTVKWSQDNLTLQWVAPESYQAEVEIQHRRDSTQPWSTFLTRTNDPVNGKYDLTVVNLEKASVQQLQMRQQSTQAKNPLWSDWSRILTVPIKFVRISKKLIDGSRRVTLRWKSVPSSDGEAVSYQVEAFGGCPCNKHPNTTSQNNNIVFGSYSAVNISVKAMNSASFSPPTLFHVPPENPPGLKVCEETALTNKTKNVCCEWYELQNGKVKEETVIILSSSKKSKTIKQNITQQLRDFLPYVYFEHSCTNNRLRTVKKCLYYKKQGKLDSAPQDFINPAGTPTTAILSWEPIPTEKQRSFITHYSLCFALAGTVGPPDCRSISTSLKNYTITELTPGSKYNISLKGVTSEGDGPPAQITINTQHEKPYSVWLSFGLLIGFFFLSILCTFVFTRIKNKVFPPVPVPVIMEFSVYQAEDQDLLERKEDTDEVTLVQLHPECRPPDYTVKHLSRTPGEGSSDVEEEEEEVDQSEEDGSTPKDSTDQTTDLVQNEIALLIYRNGLVFDVNVDSS